MRVASGVSGDQGAHWIGFCELDHIYGMCEGVEGGHVVIMSGFAEIIWAMCHHPTDV